MSVCYDCPLRLFNDKHYNLSGTGNPFAGNLIVVPNVDYSAYKKGDMSFSKQVDIINETFDIYQRSNIYIVPFIRCNESISCEINDDIYTKCLHYFKEDIKKYNFKHILLLGNVASRFLNCNINDNLDTCAISPNNRFYNVNYSPLIKFVNPELYIKFKEYLCKWYYSTLADVPIYSNYIKL